ncbi:MAG: hypothetical protein JKY15_07730 [Deltaproteobacteria bacterium]|nr:hypothetical protein [Deltaproteobacteria bacterium]
MKNYYGLNRGDSVGNRRSHKEIRVPHDGIGNRLASSGPTHNTPDDIGNSIHTAPTHLQTNVGRKKGGKANHQRMGRYIIGGVNPVVAGLSHLVPEHEESEKSEQKGSSAQADKRLRRLLELDDDRIEYTLTSTPEEKRCQAEQTLKDIFALANAEVELDVKLDSVQDKPVVQAKVKSPLFKSGDLPVIALNFLTNKIVNRQATDRIRLSVKAI